MHFHEILRQEEVGILTPLENVHFCTFMNPGASPNLDFSEVKGSKSLFRSVDLLRPITALHCDRLEAEREYRGEQR